MTFVDLPVEINVESIIDEVNADMAAQFPGWESAAGNPEAWLIRALAIRMFQPLAELAAEMGEEAFARFGELIANVPPNEAVAATVTSTWKVQDAAGYVIPAGTQVDLAISGNEAVGFVVANAVEVPAGKTETEAGQVVLEAVEAGEVGNGLKEPTLVDALSFVKTITVIGESSGGSDAEEPSEYLDRLQEMMRTLGPHPIVAEDVAILVKSIAGVERCGVLDNYNAETAESGKERTTSVYPLDGSGQPVAEAVKKQIEAMLAASREANYLFFVVTDPAGYKYNEIDVTAEVEPRPGYTKAEAAAAAKAALEDFLNPAKFGTVNGDLSTWRNELKLRYQDVVTVLNNVPAVAYYTKLEIGLHGKAKGSSDLTLEGPAPLVKPGTLTIS